MQRREFLRIAASAGVVIPSWALIPEAQAQTYTGRLLINIHADGGLDQSSWTDPRESDRTINNYAAAGTAAGVAGNIRFAPMANNAAFFGAHFRNMLVINGVHSETNDHGAGARAHATGRLDMGYPNIAELHAATHGKSLPLAWLNGGGFRTSAGLSPRIASTTAAMAGRPGRPPRSSHACAAARRCTATACPVSSHTRKASRAAMVPMLTLSWLCDSVERENEATGMDACKASAVSADSVICMPLKPCRGANPFATGGASWAGSPRLNRGSTSSAAWRSHRSATEATAALIESTAKARWPP